MVIALIEQEKYTKIKLKLILAYGAYLKKIVIVLMKLRLLLET